MAKLELQMTKDVDAIRHKLISSQQSERDEAAASATAACSSASTIVPPRVAALREAARLRKGIGIGYPPPRGGNPRVEPTLLSGRSSTMYAESDDGANHSFTISRGETEDF